MSDQTQSEQSIHSFLERLYDRSVQQGTYTHQQLFSSAIADDYALAQVPLTSLMKRSLAAMDRAQGLNLEYRLTRSARMPQELERDILPLYYIPLCPLKDRTPEEGIELLEEDKLLYLMVQDRVPDTSSYADHLMLRQVAEAASFGSHDFCTLIDFKAAEQKGDAFLKAYASWWAGCYGKMGFEERNKPILRKVLSPDVVVMLQKEGCL